jgi:Ca-activated chloride channel homolog
VTDTVSRFIVVAAVVAAGSAGTGLQDAPRFHTTVDLINVTATVTERDGRFVTGLRKEDFSVYEDGKLQSLSNFSNERAPLSLGILLDVSGSMNPQKLSAAQSSIRRLTSSLLHKDDELFFVEFGYSASLTQDWTTDRTLIARALQDVQRPTGDTALYDAIALSLPTAQSGRHGKKALLVISDGHDSHSVVTPRELQRSIFDSDVLVYALGIDSSIRNRSSDARVNEDALREITDQTGGRTEVVRGSAALDAAISSIADELRAQYLLGYSSAASKDGQWHSIRVDVRDRRVKVRARSGYMGS